MTHTEHATSVLWPMFQAEGGKTIKEWDAWLERAKNHRPRLTPLALSVRLALRAWREAR